MSSTIEFQASSRLRGPSTGQVMLPLKQLKSIDPDAELWPALQKLDRNGVNQLPVTLLSREYVISFLRTMQEVGMKPT